MPLGGRMKREPGFGNYLGETFDVMRDALPWVGLYIVIAGLLGLPSLYFQGGNANQIGLSWGFTVDEALLAQGALAVVSVIGAAIATFILQYFYYSYLLAHRGFSNGRNRLLGYLGFSILYVIGLVFGFVLLVVPGLILMVRWVAATGFVIGTDTSVIDSFGKSWNLTSGQSWPIFFANIVLSIGAFIVLGGLSATVDALLGVTSIPAMLIESFANATFGAIFAAFVVGIFYLLNDDSEHTAEVFS